MNVGFISLGCSKNLLDTEMAIGLFKNHAYTIVNDPKQADIIVVNTCGFIESAKEEAIQTILEMAKYKEKRCKILIAMGCLVQRYQKELEKALPEVDLFLSIRDYDTIWEKIEKVIGTNHIDNSCQTLEYMEREVSTGKKMAYLKIAEGCNNRCTYCAIPFIRGPYISRKKEDILEEAKMLAKKGIEEIVVIAQDTTKYGLDLYPDYGLAELLQDLEKIEGFHWIRFLYAYPESITDKLIQVVKNSQKICHYFDIPLQHISNRVLKRMNRKSDEESIRKLLQTIKTEIPDVVLRTTFIVGFPGETEEDFQKLYDFVKEIRFDRMGVFSYSKEDGTPAARLKEQIHPMTKKKRYRILMELQQEISKQKLQEQIGKTCEVLVENTSFDGKYAIARSYREVPDMDGIIYIKNPKRENWQDQFIQVKIVDSLEYDVIAEKIEKVK